MNSVAVYLYNACRKAGMTAAGACGLLANIENESSFIPHNLQNTANTKLGMSDAEYTAAVDSGGYANFAHDGYGYGLAQWTYWSRKQKLLEYARSNSGSIGDYKLQTEFILKELRESFPPVWKTLCESSDIEQCTWVLLDKWENPKEKTNNMKIRLACAQTWFAQLAKGGDTTMTKNEAIQKILDLAASQVGYAEGSNNWTKYAQELDAIDGLTWGKKQNLAWCGEYVLWLTVKAFGVDLGLKIMCSGKPSGIPLCSAGAQYFKDAGRWYTNGPQAGDIIFFYYSGGINHTGIVVSVSGSTIVTIEGNSGDKVSRNTYNINYSAIAGYGRPKYELAATEETSAVQTPSVSSSGMKYTDANKPMVCMMRQSTCYKGTSKMTPRGVLWHSTGANNPNLKRYVQPDDNASDRAALFAKLGTNPNRNDWNHTSVSAGLNAWVGKLADGTVTSVQTMPWDYKPWGCGSGGSGSCNNTHIQFEICEDALTDASYFNAVYQEACQLTAYLCKLYGLNPKGTFTYAGKQVPVILCHQDSYKLGLGSNHADVMHWFKRYGKTMDDVRSDVAKIMGGQTVTPVTVTPSVQILKKGDSGDAVRQMQEKLIKLGYNLGIWGADGDFGKDTLEAVKKFQSDHGLDNDGEVGPLTSTALDEAIKKLSASTGSAQQEEKKEFATGDVVMFTGSKHYVSASGDKGGACKAGKAKITKIYNVGSSKHPYHLVKLAGGGSTVFGWVDAKDIQAV